MRSAHKGDPFTVPEFLQSAESGRDSSRVSLDSSPEAIATLVRAADFKSRE
jgi:hypothetical protein